KSFKIRPPAMKKIDIALRRLARPEIRKATIESTIIQPSTNTYERYKNITSGSIHEFTQGHL
ncbi:hypothetical protein ACFL7M_10695, partial [Thermodesulfobacteriota bacterium]